MNYYNDIKTKLKLINQEELTIQDKMEYCSDPRILSREYILK